MEAQLACSPTSIPKEPQISKGDPPSPADSWIFGFFDFPEDVFFVFFSEIWGRGLQWMGNGSSLKRMDSQLISNHMDPFSMISMISVILLSFSTV